MTQGDEPHNAAAMPNAVPEHHPCKANGDGRPRRSRKMPTKSRAYDVLKVSPLWKTRLCSFDAGGVCRNGVGCAFAHGEQDLRPMPDFEFTSVCPSMLASGVCKRKDCRYAHVSGELKQTPNLLKTRMCSFFLNGECVVGAACRFAHDACELQQAVLVQRLVMENVKMPDTRRAVRAKAGQPCLSPRRGSRRGAATDRSVPRRSSSRTAERQGSQRPEGPAEDPFPRVECGSTVPPARSPSPAGVVPPAGPCPPSSRVSAGVQEASASPTAAATRQDPEAVDASALPQGSDAAGAVASGGSWEPPIFGSPTAAGTDDDHHQGVTSKPGMRDHPPPVGTSSVVPAQEAAGRSQGQGTALIAPNLDTAAEAVAAAMAAAPKAARAVLPAKGRQGGHAVIRLAVDVDLELEAALASSRNRHEVDVALPPVVSAREPREVHATTSMKSAFAKIECASEAAGEAPQNVAVEPVRLRGTSKAVASARSLERSGIRQTTPVTIMDIEDVSFMAELCTRIGVDTSEVGSVIGLDEDAPGMLRKQRSARQPAPVRKGNGPNCSGCPMAPLDVPCGIRSSDPSGARGCAATQASSTASPSSSAAGAHLHTEARWLGRQSANHATISNEASCGSSHHPGRGGCNSGHSSGCALCRSEEELCPACNCGLRVVMRNTFLTVDEGESEGAKHAFRRSRSL